MSTRRGPARARQVLRIREIEAARKGGRRPATGTDAAFPVFGERQKREFDASPYPMRITEHGTLKYLAVNDAAVKLYGYTRDEFLELTVFQTRHPEEHDQLLAMFAEPTGYFNYGPPRRRIKKSGEIILAELVTQDILFKGRKARLSLTLDVTERKRTEQALRESNEFLRSMIESSRDCIKVLDLDGRLLMMSAGGQSLLQVDDITPMLNTQWLEFWKGGDRDAALAALATARAGSVGKFEGYCPTIKGEPKWWDVILTPILDVRGRPEKLLAVSRDVTRRKRAQDALQESEERFRQIAENIREVFWISTPGSEKVIYVSPGFEEIWGRSRESLYNDPRSWMAPIHPEDLRAVQRGQEKMVRGEGADVEYRIVRPDGTLRWIRDRGYPTIRGDGTMLLYGFAEDITDLKRAEEARLAHAIHQRDALVREVHHRIKNSLQGVAGLLRQKIGKYPAIAPGIEEAVAQLQSVALVYGLQETRPDGLLDLAEITNAICSSAESLIGGHVERTFERNSQRPACLAGAAAVSVAVAINELVFNALKHQPAEAGEKRARVTLCETGDAAEIRITNRGRLPAGFDYAGGGAAGNGLGLVRTLLASPGGAVAFNGGSNEVEVILKLAPPLLADRQETIAR
jgi:PAS domain S-box-containing protein